ncbi:MAG: hypothetical protein IH623_19110 [Verrucomicrobia bacterium]|nr:hypothetical protein [Verrucomicrobiota bacterium]
MNLGEEYRWNIKTITYGIDESFLNYFGQRGVDEINKAFAILNNLPAVSQISPTLEEFPLDTRRENLRASALFLLDLKSAALGLLVEQLGLTSPDRYVWCLRDRRVINNVGFYLVIKRNFDPVTFAPSSYVNGVLYTYAILQFTEPDWWDAIEVPLDPQAFGYTAVASDFGSIASGVGGTGGPGLSYGQFYTGLTRDDVGGLRYLYRPNNYNIEDLVPGTTGSGLSGSPWDLPGGGGTNGVTNAVVGVALRPGVDRLTFRRAEYDSVFGNFIIITNRYQDTFYTNGTRVTQTAERILVQPDILITAEDLGLTTGGTPVFVRRNAGWINNDALNGQAALDGPGIIAGQIVLAFSKVGPHMFNQGLPGPAFLDQFNSLGSGFIWGSFDGTTNAPVVYPIGSSIQELEQRVLGGN